MELEYMLLSRCQQDCEFFLGYGNRLEKFLWSLNVKDHITNMKDLWNAFEEKPEWISYEDILDYEKAMS